VQVTAAAGASRDTAADDFTYMVAPTRFEQTDPHIAYSAGWSLYPAPPTTGPASAGNYSRANTPDSSATIYFKGERLDWIAMKGTTTGKANVQLDNEPVQTVDLANPAGALYQVNVWSTPPLDDGLHKVKISWDPSNAASKYITLDAVDVVGTLVSAPPSITGLSPATGSTDGGNNVTINGTGFTEVSKVTFGELDATTYTVDSPTKITAVAPAHTAETVRVQVTTAGGATSDTTFDNYTYAEIVVPTVTGLDPTSGLGGTTVAITGTGFVGVTAVTFGGASATGITVTDTGHLTAVAPAHAAGAIDVVVTALGGSSSPEGAWNDFMYLTPPVLNKYEQSAPGLYWTGTWTAATSSYYSGSSYKYTNTSGASVSFAFYGTQFSLIGKKTYSLGNASVSIDGGAAATVDLYSKTTAYKATVYTSPALPDGLHTVKISRAGTKNPSSSGYSVNVDALNIAGTLAAYVKAEQTDTRIAYQWTWGTISTTSASGSSYRQTNSTAGSFSIPFSGTIELYAALRFNMGKADIYLDGVKEMTIDLASATSLYKQKVATVTAPDRGVHVLSVVRSPENPSNLYINLDYAMVAGSLPVATTFEQNNTKILYTGVWTSASSTSYSGGSHKYTDAAGALATVSFTGVRISLVCRKSAGYGILWVRLDGGDPIPVDLYSASTLYKQTVWTSPFISPGEHTLTIESSGTKRAGASGVRIDFDAVKVIGTLR
jgi:IPT/TIG domain